MLLHVNAIEFPFLISHTLNLGPRANSFLAYFDKMIVALKK